MGLSGNKFRKLVPLIMVRLGGLRLKKRHPRAAQKRYESLNLGNDPLEMFGEVEDA
jgi:hypothetical protein